MQSYLLSDEDIEGRKSSKAKELGWLISDPYTRVFLFKFFVACIVLLISISSCSTPFLSEDGLFDMIRSSKRSKAPVQEESKGSVEKVVPLPKKSPQKAVVKSMLHVTICLF